MWGHIERVWLSRRLTTLAYLLSTSQTNGGPFHNISGAKTLLGYKSLH